MRSWVARGAAVVTVALASTCTRAPESRPPGPPLAIEVEYAGCTEVNAGPVCNIAPGSTLVVWAKSAPTAELGVTVHGDTVVTSTRTALDDGSRWRLQIPTGARAVLVEGVEAASTARVVIPLTYLPLPPALAEADRLRAAGQFAEAEAALATIDTATDALRARVLGKRARLAMATGRTDEALLLFQQAIALDHSTGLLSGEIADRAALGYALLYQAQRFADADEVLRPLEALASQVPQARTTASYFLGLLEHATNDLRGAVAHLRTARIQATRLDMERERRAALDMEIDTLYTLGQSARAQPLLESMAATAVMLPSACERAVALHNVGFHRMQAGDLDEETLRFLRDAVDLAAGPCPNPRFFEHHSATLARALAAMGRAGEARAVLDRVPGLATSTRPEVAWADADVALLEHDHARASAQYQRFRTLMLDASFGTWISHLGLAKVHLDAGDRARAIEALSAAEDTLESYAFLVPYGAGRSTFLDSYGESSRLLVDLLVDGGRIEEAWRAARHARRRGLASLSWRARVSSLDGAARTRWYTALTEHRRQRAQIDAEAADDWTLSADRLSRTLRARRERVAQIQTELEATFAAVAPWPSHAEADAAPLERGELAILLHDVPHGSVMFGALDGQVIARRVGVVTATDTPQSLGAQLLGPLEAQLARAQRVRVWSSGSLETIDVHTLPIAGVPLVARMPVVYALDVGAPALAAGEARDASVVIVADPRGDLDEARREASLVTAAAERAGRPSHLLAGDGSTREALERQLGSTPAALLHVASHAVYEGVDGWDSHVRLAHNDILSIADILTLEGVPPRVVLSGCETGRNAEGHATSLSLAHALILSGARAVVATTQPIDDRQASIVMAELYGSPDFLDLPAALARAQREIIRRAPDVGWASFRVVVP